MKEHILPRIILPRSLAAFVATLAVWGLFSFIPSTGTGTNSGPYSALDQLLVPPAAAHCDHEICTGYGACIPETLELNCESALGKCRDWLCL